MAKWMGRLILFIMVGIVLSLHVIPTKSEIQTQVGGVEIYYRSCESIIQFDGPTYVLIEFRVNDSMTTLVERYVEEVLTLYNDPYYEKFHIRVWQYDPARTIRLAHRNQIAYLQIGGH